GTIFHHAKANGWKPPPGSRQVASSAAGEALRDIVGEVELWHDDRDQAYATIIVGSDATATHKEHHAVGGPAFRSWLERAFWKRTGVTPKSEELKEVIGLARSKARFDGAR